MKILLDQGLPRTAAQHLRDAWIDAVHTGECNLASAPDGVILDFARDNERIELTLNSDFHALMAISNAAGPSVIRIRIEGFRAQGLAKLLRRVLEHCREDLAKGAMVSVVEGGIRVRNLPVARPP